MKTQPTPTQIRSAKIQGMTPASFVKGVEALAASLERGKSCK